MVIAKKIQNTFYLSLFIQIIWRLLTLLVHKYYFGSIGYLAVYTGGVWLFLLTPISLIAFFFLLKKEGKRNLLKNSILLILTFIIVFVLGFL